MLHDRLVCGIRQLSIQRWLLAEPTLTLKCGLELVLAMESAERDTEIFREQRLVPLRDKFRFKDSVCHGWNKKGNLVRCCRNAQRRPNKSSTNIHEVVEDPISQLYTLPSSKTKLLKTVVNIYGKEVEMEIEESVSVMTHKEYKGLWSPVSRQPLCATGINWRCIPERWLKSMELVNHGHEPSRRWREITISYCRVWRTNLLRKDWLIKLKLDWHMINQVRVKEELTTLISWHFSERTRYNQRCIC